MLTSGTVVCIYLLQVLKVVGTDKVFSVTYRLMIAHESLIFVSCIKCTAVSGKVQEDSNNKKM